MPPKKSQKTRSKRGKGFLSSVVDIGLAGVGGVAGVDETINKLFPGERHGVLVLPDGRKAWAQFMGPSTNITARLRRGDQGLTNVDKASKAHDLRYSLAKSDYDIGLADRKMMAAVDRFPDNPINKAQAKLIKVKQALDKLGFRIGSTYGSKELDNDPQLLNLYKSELGKLARQGFGRGSRGNGRGSRGRGRGRHT